MNMTIEIFSQSKVAGIHERGGTVNPGRAMPIPLNEEARHLLRDKMDLGHLSPIKRDGKVFLAKTEGRKRAKFMFILRRNIRIRPRLGFYQTWGTHEARRVEILERAMVSAFDKT